MVSLLRVLADSLDQLKEYMKVCYFCGKLLSGDMINTGCFQNRSKNMPFNCVVE